MQTTSLKKLSPIERKLIAAAERQLKKSYSPYSKFSVGAALLTIDNKIFAGTNIENASYSNTICAERVVLAKAMSDGYRKFKIIAIITNSEKIFTPCGSCRQMLSEAARITGRDIKIIMSSKNKKKIAISSIGELLPCPFGLIK